MRLVQIAEHYWFEIDGELALAGVDLMRLPFRRQLTAVMSWANPRGARKDTELDEYIAWLFSPFEVADIDNVSQEVIDNEMAAFRAFSKQTGG